MSTEEKAERHRKASAEHYARAEKKMAKNAKKAQANCAGTATTTAAFTEVAAKTSSERDDHSIMIDGPAPAPKTLTEIAVGMESQLEEEADSAYFLEILAGSLMSNSSSGGRFYQSSKATADKTRLAISLSAHSDEMLDEMIVAATLTQIGSAASIDSILEDSDSVLELAEQLTSNSSTSSSAGDTVSADDTTPLTPSRAQKAVARVRELNAAPLTPPSARAQAAWWVGKVGDLSWGGHDGWLYRCGNTPVENGIGAIFLARFVGLAELPGLAHARRRSAYPDKPGVCQPAFGWRGECIQPQGLGASGTGKEGGVNRRR
ncbi:hypothetical protein C8J57DRAFT_1226282 [Mycena rebaudengoi]|nr:hypothetical protein C8J57DRAFT_1226282 [Mycena rebaudengoi]